MKKMLITLVVMLTMAFTLHAEEIIPVRTDVAGFSTWTDVDITGTTYIQLAKATASITSPSMDFSSYTGKTLNFKARTFNGTNAVENTVTVSISEDNGASWTEIGTRTPTTNTLTAMEAFDLSAYNLAQTKIKFTVAGTSNTIGIGIDDITISGTMVITGPTILLNTTAIIFNPTKVNTVSETKSFTIEAVNLTEDVIVTSPDGFVVSLPADKGVRNSKNSITIPHVTGTVSPTTISVTFEPVAGQVYTGNITCTSTGATTKNIAVSGIGLGTEYVSFTNFEDGTLSGWTAYSVLSDKNWGVAAAGANSTAKSAEMNGYVSSTGSPECNDWLISPALTWTAITKDYYSLDFFTNRYYGTDNSELTLKYSTNYTGTGDPTAATWTDLSFTKPDAASSSAWTASGIVDLTGITTFPVYFAFQYLSAVGNFSRWRVDEISIKRNSGSAITSSNTVNSAVVISAYPNPFNPATSISFNLPTAQNGQLSVYNAQGQKVAELFNGAFKAGVNSYSFNAANLNSGVYYCKLTAGTQSYTQKMVLTK